MKREYNKIRLVPRPLVIIEIDENKHRRIVKYFTDCAIDRNRRLKTIDKLINNNPTKNYELFDVK